MAQIGTTTDTGFMGMLGGTNKPVHCSSAGHLNSPVINIVDKSQRTEHSHAFDAPKPDDMKRKLNAAVKGIKAITSKLGTNTVKSLMGSYGGAFFGR